MPEKIVSITKSISPGNTEERPSFPALKNQKIIVNNGGTVLSINLPTTIHELLTTESLTIAYSKSIVHLMHYAMLSNVAEFNFDNFTVSSIGYGKKVQPEIFIEWTKFTSAFFDHQKSYEELTAIFGYLPLMENNGNVPIVGTPYQLTYEIYDNSNTLNIINVDYIDTIFKLYTKVRINGGTLTLAERLKLRDISTHLMVLALKPYVTGTPDGRRAVTVNLSESSYRPKRLITDIPWHQISWALFCLYLIYILVLDVELESVESDNEC